MPLHTDQCLVCHRWTEGSISEADWCRILSSALLLL